MGAQEDSQDVSSAELPETPEELEVEKPSLLVPGAALSPVASCQNVVDRPSIGFDLQGLCEGRNCARRDAKDLLGIGPPRLSAAHAAGVTTVVVGELVSEDESDLLIEELELPGELSLVSSERAHDQTSRHPGDGLARSELFS
jgi:hypothetical protein